MRRGPQQSSKLAGMSETPMLLRAGEDRRKSGPALNERARLIDSCLLPIVFLHVSRISHSKPVDQFERILYNLKINGELNATRLGWHVHIFLRKGDQSFPSIILMHPW